MKQPCHDIMYQQDVMANWVMRLVTEAAQMMFYLPQTPTQFHKLWLVAFAAHAHMHRSDSQFSWLRRKHTGRGLTSIPVGQASQVAPAYPGRHT